MDVTPEKTRLLSALRAANLTTPARTNLIGMIGRVETSSSFENVNAAASIVPNEPAPSGRRSTPQQQRLQIRFLISVGAPWSEVQLHLRALAQETSDSADVTHYIEMATVAGDCPGALSIFGDLPGAVVAKAWDAVHPQVRQSLVEWMACDERTNGKTSIASFVGMLAERISLRGKQEVQATSWGETRNRDLSATPGELLLLAKVLLQSCSGHAVASFVVESLAEILHDLRQASFMDSEEVNGILTGLAEHCAWVGAYDAVKALLIDFPEAVQMSSRQMALLAEAAAALHPASDDLWADDSLTKFVEAPPVFLSLQTADWRGELQSALNAQRPVVRPRSFEGAVVLSDSTDPSDSTLIPDRSVQSMVAFLQRNASLSPTVLMRLAQHEADCGHPAQAVEVLRQFGSHWHYTNPALSLLAKVALSHDDRELGDEAQMIFGLRHAFGEYGGVAPNELRKGPSATYWVREPRQELTAGVRSFWDKIAPTSAYPQSKKLEKGKSLERESSPNVRIKMAAQELNAAAAVCRLNGVPIPSWTADVELRVPMPGFIDSFSENPWTRIFLCVHEALSASAASAPKPEIALLLTTVCCGNGAAAMDSLEAMRVPIGLRWTMESWLLSRERFDPS